MGPTPLTIYHGSHPLMAFRQDMLELFVYGGVKQLSSSFLQASLKTKRETNQAVLLQSGDAFYEPVNAPCLHEFWLMEADEHQFSIGIKVYPNRVQSGYFMPCRLVIPVSRFHLTQDASFDALIPYIADYLLFPHTEKETLAFNLIKDYPHYESEIKAHLQALPDKPFQGLLTQVIH